MEIQLLRVKHYDGEKLILQDKDNKNIKEYTKDEVVNLHSIYKAFKNYRGKKLYKQRNIRKELTQIIIYYVNFFNT